MFINYGPAQQLLDAARAAVASPIEGIPGMAAALTKLQEAIKVAEEAMDLSPAQKDDVVRARDIWESHDVEIDDHPVVSESDHGTWVSAWVWVDHNEEEFEPEDEESETCEPE